MRKSFPGYYRPTDEEFSAIWNNCLFILDANVLLNLYRYSQETSEELIGILEEVSSRLWIPHQAALEYQQQRLQVISKQIEVYEEMQDLLDKTENQLSDKLNSLRRHPYIDTDYLFNKIRRAFVAIKKELKRIRQEHPDLLQCDSLRDTLDTLFKGRVGLPYSIERLDEIYKIGKSRFDREIPPGYKDIEKDGVKKYGDLILWLQIIDKAKETKKPIILITDDKKDDWWLRFKGQIISPRPELVDEILSEANVPFYLYQSDPFMLHAQKFLEKQINQKAIDEVRDFRKRDDEYLAMSKMMLSSVQLPDETLRAMREMASFRFPDDTLRAMREAASVRLPDETLRAMREMASFRLPDDTLRAMREAASVRLPDETLRAMREMASFRLPDDTLRAMREAASVRLPDETLRAMREMASIRLPDDTLRAMMEAQEAIKAFQLSSEALRSIQAITSFYQFQKSASESIGGDDNPSDSENKETD